LALFNASSGFEFKVLVTPLLKITKYPLEIAHFPVSFTAVVVVDAGSDQLGERRGGFREQAGNRAGASRSQLPVNPRLK